MLAHVLLAVLLAAPAAPPTPSPAAPTPVEQGAHTGSLVAGEDAVFAVELDGGLARTQLGLELPPDAGEVQLTLTFSVPDAPAQACTRNAVVLTPGSEERPGLDSRRTDAPDPDDPCTQPGTHLLTASVEDREGTLGDDPIPFTLLLSVIGEDAAVPTPSPVTSERSATAAPAPVAASEASDGARAERRPLGRALAITVAVLAVLGGAAVLVRRRTAGS